MTSAAGALAYLDASAFVKLVVEEPESAALGKKLEAWPLRVSSALLAVEGVRAPARIGEDAARRAEEALADVTLVPASLELLRSAASLPPPMLRSLDAVHLATALSLGEDLGAFFAYDERLIDAAVAHSIAVESPSPR